ncbi:MAG: tape measure protein, partial [Sporomusa sp.]
MSTISSTLVLQDRMTRPMQAITKAMGSTLKAIRSIEGAKLGPEFAQAAADVRLAENAVEQMNTRLQEVPTSTDRVGQGFTVMKGLAVRAISSITSSIKSELTAALDRAFDRIDTMEQFSRTMGVLTGSSNVAAYALEDVRKIVTGTAYGLDTAASAVQGFTTSGMGVTKSIAQFEGLANAVAFYGSGTDEQLQRVTTAWQKMATSGKASAEKIESFTDAGIPVYAIYAKAVGKSTAQVQKMMSQGEITAAQFQDVLTEAFETGVEGFPSVANAAQKAGASWEGTFSNMHAATTRGMQGIINSIDEALTRNNLPELRAIVKSTGAEFEATLNNVALVVGDLIDLFGKIPDPIQEAFGPGALAGLDAMTEKLGGFQKVWGTTAAVAITAANLTKITWYSVNDGLLTSFETLHIKFLGISFGIVGAFGDMRVKMLTTLDDLINGAISRIDRFISAVNQMTGANISLVSDIVGDAQFSVGIAAQNDMDKATRGLILAGQTGVNATRQAGRETELAGFRADLGNDWTARMNKASGKSNTDALLAGLAAGEMASLGLLEGISDWTDDI